MEARDVCLQEGGDLLSILNTEEQSFAITQLGYCKFRSLPFNWNAFFNSVVVEKTEVTPV